MQRLWAEDEVDIRRAADDRSTFLRRDATANADQNVGAQRLDLADTPEVVEHALLRLLAHRAGVEQDDIGVVGTVGQGQSIGVGEHIGHPVRIVLVHLAAERANEELASHWRCFERGRDYIKRL